MSQQRDASLAHSEEQLHPDDRDAFFRTLNDTEQSHVDSYEKRWPGEVFQLNQDPLVSHCSHSNPWAMQVLIHNYGRLWMQSPRVGPRRWLFGTELLTSLGFPVIPFTYGLTTRSELAQLDLCSFSHPNADRDPRHIGAQCGNSMSIPVMSVIHNHSWLCWPRARITPHVFNLVQKSKAAKTAEEAASSAAAEDAQRGHGKRRRIRSKTPSRKR